MADCAPDYPVLGMQAGEELATLLRLVALVFSISILFPWLDSERRGRMRIFFLHWFSGAMYVMSQFIMSVMVLNCWSSKKDSGPVIYFLKFVELTVLNLWSISSLAIAVLIASIVQSFVKCRRVPATIGSARTSYLCVAAAVLATVLSAVFWNGILITGGYFWVANNDNTVAGMLMALAVVFTVTGERFSSLKVCCKTSQHVKFHFILTIFGTCVYLYNGIVLLFDEFSDAEISKRLVIIGWCSRYVHVVADTGIIFGAFYALEKKEKEGQQDANPRSPPGLEGSIPQTRPTTATTARPGPSSTITTNYNPSNLEAGLSLEVANGAGSNLTTPVPRPPSVVASGSGSGFAAGKTPGSKLRAANRGTPANRGAPPNAFFGSSSVSTSGHGSGGCASHRTPSRRTIMTASKTAASVAPTTAVID